MNQLNDEPSYLKLSKREKKSFLKKLLIIPIITILLSILLFISGLFPSLHLTSFKRWSYYEKSMHITEEFIHGEMEDLLKHSFIYNSGDKNVQYAHVYLSDIYDDILFQFNSTYNKTLKDKNIYYFVSSLNFIGRNPVGNEIEYDNEYWVSTCYIIVDNKDFLTLHIYFSSTDNYRIEIQPCDNSNAKEWALCNNWLVFVNNIISGSSKEQDKIIRTIVNGKDIDTLIKEVGSKFILNGLIDNSNRKLCDYQQFIGTELYELREYYSIDEVNIETIGHDSYSNKPKVAIKIIFSDNLNKKCYLSVKCLYTPHGYEILENDIGIVPEAGFKKGEILKFINGLKVFNETYKDNLRWY